MGFSFATLGVAPPQAMFLAISNSLEKQLQGMTRFIDNNPNCLTGFRENDLVKFASCYNGAYRPPHSILIPIAVVLLLARFLCRSLVAVLV